MRQPDVWDLIKSGRFEEATVLADLEYEKIKNVFPLRNKVYALFNLERYEEAILLLEWIIQQEKGESESDFEFLGIALWLLHQESAAVETWKKSENSMYKDASGGVEVQMQLYFAAVSMNDTKLKTEVGKKIRKLLKSKRAMYWPGPLGHYILNELSKEELISQVATTPTLKERQLCQANFVIAIKELEKNDMAKYREGLEACVSLAPACILEPVYYLAKGSLKACDRQGL